MKTALGIALALLVLGGALLGGCKSDQERKEDWFKYDRMPVSR